MDLLNRYPVNGKFQKYGGRYVPEILMDALIELEESYEKFKCSEEFSRRLNLYLSNYAGRSTPLYYAKNLTEDIDGAKILLKREDLLHGGAHKINNTLGQALLAEAMGKRRVIAETGAGQHGVATSMACAVLGLKAEIYMGERDMRRQKLNVFRMRLMGAKVHPVSSGSKTLKDAINEALKDWVSNLTDTYYLIGSTVGPHPYPMIVRDFQSIIGREIKEQTLRMFGRLPDVLVACVGGGSNAMGTFYPFLDDSEVKMYGVEASGVDCKSGKHSASLKFGDEGVFHGMLTHVIQDENGQIKETHSIAAGLDYPAVGPEHSFLKSIGRVEYDTINDDEAVKAFEKLAKTEGIIPALESSHAIAYALRLAEEMSRDEVIVVTLSGRGDKDVEVVADYLRSVSL